MIIAIADLLEAEGRALRRGVGRLVAATVILGMAGLIALTGSGLVLWGLYAWLRPALGAATAGAATGAAALTIAGILTWAAQRSVR